MKIGERRIGPSEGVFIIAEAGVNHNGSLETAKKLVDAAFTAGADAVKFQTFKAEDVVTANAGLAAYQEKNLEEKESQQGMLRKYELSDDETMILKQYCDDKSILFLSTPHSETAVDLLEGLVPAYKIGSGDLTNIPMLKDVAKKGKPVLLGTGMAMLDEVKEAVSVIKSQGNEQVVALHCTTEYPCPPEDVNMRAFQTMQKELDCLVGYSDHTLGTAASKIARALGAVVIEKHFTLDRNMQGPDHNASLEPEELKKMVEEVKGVKSGSIEDFADYENILGSAEKKPTEKEIEIMKLVRKSIIARTSIQAGTIIEREMLCIKRPGTGIEPKMIDTIVGKRAKQDIPKDSIMRMEDLA